VVTGSGYGYGAPSRYSPPVEERYQSELVQSTRVLDDVDRALERLTAGTYDTCERCGDPITEADLALDPTQRVCRQHQVQEVAEADPVLTVEEYS
jgi:RNA polymerase-binding transcription factor DksA